MTNLGTVRTKITNLGTERTKITNLGTRNVKKLLVKVIKCMACRYRAYQDY